MEWNEPPASNWLGPGPTLNAWALKLKGIFTQWSILSERKKQFVLEESDVFFFQAIKSLRETKFDGLNLGIRTIDNGVIFLSDE